MTNPIVEDLFNKGRASVYLAKLNDKEIADKLFETSILANDTTSALLALEYNADIDNPFALVAARNTFLPDNMLNFLIRHYGEIKYEELSEIYFAAISNSNDRTVRWLIDNNYHVDVNIHNGRTPLAYAIMQKRPKISYLLYRSGANLEV